MQKANQEEFRIEKVIKGKSDKIYVRWKRYDSSCNSWIDKAKNVEKRPYKMSQYFPPYDTSTKNIKGKLDLSNYVTKDDKTDILKLEDKIKENEKEASFNRGFFYYKGGSDFVYECQAKSFNYGNIYITAWKSTDILNYPTTNHMNAFKNSKIKLLSLISNISPRVYLEGNYFKQNGIKTSNISIINIYSVYELKEIISSRNNEFTIQNALFGVVKITKNTDTSSNKYKDIVFVLMEVKHLLTNKKGAIVVILH